MSKIYEIMENIQGNYVEAYLISYNEFKELKQALEDKDQEINLLKRDVENNEIIRKEAIRIGKNRLQSKLDKIKEVIKQNIHGTDAIVSKYYEIRDILKED